MKISHERKLYLLGLIKGPCFTEKAEQNLQFQHFVFEVLPRATKADIKQAISVMFEEVQIAQIRTLNVKGKVKNFKQIKGKQKNWKKAYVSLHSGSTINLVRN